MCLNFRPSHCCSVWVKVPNPEKWWDWQIHSESGCNPPLHCSPHSKVKLETGATYCTEVNLAFLPVPALSCQSAYSFSTAEFLPLEKSTWCDAGIDKWRWLSVFTSQRTLTDSLSLSSNCNTTDVQLFITLHYKLVKYQILSNWITSCSICGEVE